jgi:hypothetical protein
MAKSLLLLAVAAALSMGVTAQVITPAPSAYGGVGISELLLQKRDDFYPCDGKASICKSIPLLARFEHPLSSPLHAVVSLRRAFADKGDNGL